MLIHIKYEPFLVRSTFYVIFCIFYSHICLSSTKEIILNNQSEVIYFNHHIADYYIDTTRILGISELCSKSFTSQFKPLTSELNNSKSPNAVYWLKFKIQQGIDATHWIVELPDPHIGQAELFYVTKNSAKSLGKIGHAIPASLRQYHHKNLVLPLNTPPNGTYLLRLESNQISSFMVILRKIDSFISNSLWGYYVFGLYYGILLIMFAYNLFLVTIYFFDLKIYK